MRSRNQHGVRLRAVMSPAVAQALVRRMGTAQAGGSTRLTSSNMSSRHVACGESDWGPWLASARVTGCPWLANKQALTRSRNGFALLQRHDVWRHDRLGSLARKRESDWVPQNMSTCKCGHAAGKASRRLPGGSSRIAHRPRLVTARVRCTSQLTDQVSSRLPRPSGSRTPR